MYVCMYVYVCVCMYVCICVVVCMYVCVYVCGYVQTLTVSGVRQALENRGACRRLNLRYNSIDTAESGDRNELPAVFRQFLKRNSQMGGCLRFIFV